MDARILVDDWCLHRGAAGVSTYLANVLAHWPGEAELRPEPFWPHLPGWVRRGLANAESNPPPLRFGPLRDLGRPGRLGRRLPHAARQLVQRLYGRAFARRFGRGRYPACWQPNHLAEPVAGPVVTTMHDLSVLEHPEWHPPDRVAQWRARLGDSLQTTTRWIAVSQFTRRRMIDLLGIRPDRVDVIHEAARRFPAERARQAGDQPLPPRYILHLGTIEPRKNLSLLLEAWRALPKATRGHLRLVLAGGIGWGQPADFRALVDSPVAQEVLVTGYVRRADAGRLLRNALAAVVPSRYEGFGLPVLEGMAAGTPVICSDAEVFAEVAAGAAMVCPADDPAPWAHAIRRLDTEPELRESLAAAGAARAAQFDWRRAAEQHLATFQMARAAGDTP